MAVLLLCACSQTQPAQRSLTAELPLHLEDHLDVATLEGSEARANVGDVVEWSFAEPQPDWKAARPSGFEPLEPIGLDDALRLRLIGAHRHPGSGRLVGEIYVALPEWSREDWSFVEIRARASEGMQNIGLDFNYTTDNPWSDDGALPFAASGDWTPLVANGEAQTYRLSLSKVRVGNWVPPWTHLAIWCTAKEEATLDLLSVKVIPKEAAYAEAPAGVRTELRGTAHRRSLYVHTPGRLGYRIRVPQDGRLDLALGVLRSDTPVTFRITAETAESSAAEILFEESYADRGRWAQRSVDLARFAGESIELGLEADAERPGSVALWAAPTLTGARKTQKPNVVFYVIDGGSADHMSLYGYNRRTTPNLERLSAEGASFEHAYSNATWTTPSTTSFLTSLHTSVLGGFSDGTMLPDQAVPMAEHFHRAGYQTAAFTTNGYAGSVAGLERGVDVFRDAGERPGTTPSEDLHGDYWRWREAYPGEPYWVHFQTTDVHRPFSSVPPFSGLYVGPELRQRYTQWEHRLVDAVGRRSATLARPEIVSDVGIDPGSHFEARRGLMDEAMAQQDYQLGRLVARLKAAGEWERTLLVVAADHGPVGIPYPWSALEPMFRSSSTRVPLLFVWPGHIRGGQRFSQPVSMIDVLPTLLDLLDLPMPEVAQGQSLAPLMLGEPGWETRPVFLDEFQLDRETGKLRGVIEVVDGRWGASLEVNPHPDRFPRQGDQPLQRTVPLLLFDLWEDPKMEHSLHEERPDLVEKYTEILEAQWRAHQRLSQRFTRSERTSVLTPEQLRTLRSLGYID